VLEAAVAADKILLALAELVVVVLELHQAMVLLELLTQEAVVAVAVIQVLQKMAEMADQV
jgi:hypothetical protein